MRQRTRQYILSMEEDGTFFIQPICYLEMYTYQPDDEITYDALTNEPIRARRVRYEGRFRFDEAPDACHTPTYRTIEKALIHASDLQQLEREAEKLQNLINKSKKDLMDSIFGKN